MPTNKELEVIVKRLTESVARLEVRTPGGLYVPATGLSAKHFDISMVWQSSRGVWLARWGNVEGAHEDPKQALEILFQKMTKAVGG